MDELGRSTLPTLHVWLHRQTQGTKHGGATRDAVALHTRSCAQPINHLLLSHVVACHTGHCAYASGVPPAGEVPFLSLQWLLLSSQFAASSICFVQSDPQVRVRLSRGRHLRLRCRRGLDHWPLVCGVRTALQRGHDRHV
jgi:hypothetical protein